MKTSRTILLLFLIGLVGWPLAANAAHHSRKRFSRRVPAIPGQETATNTLVHENDEDRRFQEVKAKAENDPAILKLKAESDAATAESEVRSAATSYNRALFAKMRELDRSLSERTDLVESAILRRINE